MITDGVTCQIMSGTSQMTSQLPKITADQLCQNVSFCISYRINLLKIIFVSILNSFNDWLWKAI